MFVPSLRAQSHIAGLAFGTDDRGRHFKQGMRAFKIDKQVCENKLVNIDKV